MEVGCLRRQDERRAAHLGFEDIRVLGRLWLQEPAPAVNSDGAGRENDVADGGARCGRVDGGLAGSWADEHLDMNDAAVQIFKRGCEIELVEGEVGHVEIDLTRAQRPGRDQ